MDCVVMFNSLIFLFHKFVFPKWQLSGRKTIVLGFGIEPLAHKFKLLNVNEGDVQNGGAINYEIALECNILPSPGYESYVIGSEFYQHIVGGETNFIIKVKLYDIEMAQSCYGDGYGNENNIEITVRKNMKLLRTFIIEKSTFIKTHEFELDMQGDVKVVNLLPHSKVNVEAGTNSNSSRGQTLSPMILRRKRPFITLLKKQ